MLQAEKQLIGSILIDQTAIDSIYDIIRPEMFTSDFYRDCYLEMLAKYDRNENIDMFNISHYMSTSKNYSLEFVNTELTECVAETPLSFYAKSYAETMVKDYKCSVAKKLFDTSSTSPKDIENTIAEVITRLEELQENEKQKSKTMKRIVEENKANYFTEKNVLDNSVQTGLYQLDECLGGLQGGDITIIGARPAVGKSALALQIIRYVAESGKKVGYFNLEMVESQVYERFVADKSEIDMVRVRRANTFLGDEKERFEKANEVLSGYNITISTGGKTDADIKAECRHQNYDLIVIDYLQLVRSHKRCESRRVEVGEVSRSLKNLAMELNVPIILLSQLSRKSEIASTNEPSMDDLRETGDIEQDASTIILLWNLCKDGDTQLKKHKGLKVDKNRNGELLREPLRFDGSHMRFEERKGTTIEQELKNIKDKANDFTTNFNQSDVPWEA